MERVGQFVFAVDFYEPTSGIGVLRQRLKKNIGNVRGTHDRLLLLQKATHRRPVQWTEWEEYTMCCADARPV
jgi:hypothetical protein